MSRLVVELAGPAGAGKTTLARTLLGADVAETTVGVEVSRPRLAAAVASVSPHLLLARASARGRWWTREEMRSLAYLCAWRRAVRPPADKPAAEPAAGPGLLLLDHGPVFRLASLTAFGPPMAATSTFARVSTGLAEDWGGLLDVVVWLDAPDDVLLRRIAGRARAHRLRGASRAEAEDFLARYRAAYRTALRQVAGHGAQVLELDTTSSSPDELAVEVRRALLQSPERRSSCA